MDSEVDYSKLTINELKILINADDGKAIEEFAKRVRVGEIELKNYTKEQLVEIISKNIKAQIKSDADYLKLTPRELKHLITINDPKADEEFDRRVRNGEIKTRRVTFEDIRKMYNKDKAS